MRETSLPLPFDLRSLEIFLAVCETGSMSSAARTLGLTQPAVSLAVSDLERRLGFDLFDRDVRPLAVTVAGGLLRQRAGALIAEARQIGPLLRDTEHGKVALIRVGMVDSLSRVLTEPLARFLATRAGEVSILQGLTASHASDLLTRRLDLFLGVDDLGDWAGLERWPLVKEPYVLVLPAGTEAPRTVARVAQARGCAAAGPFQLQIADRARDRSASEAPRACGAARVRVRYALRRDGDGGGGARVRHYDAAVHPGGRTARCAAGYGADARRANFPQADTGGAPSRARTPAARARRDGARHAGCRRLIAIIGVGLVGAPGRWVDDLGRGGRMRRGKGWYATFALLVVALFAAIYALTGQDALGAAGRFLWNGLVLVASGAIRLGGGLLELVARGVGWRRLSRVFSGVTAVGLGYAASVVVSDGTVTRARGWRGKLQAAIQRARTMWQDLALVLKLAVVAGLIASQVYLHNALVLFPIAFLVPVVRGVWVRTADLLFGSWYWNTFGGTHRAIVSTLRRLPPVRIAIDGSRLLRLRYLYAWRLWRYDPRYKDPASDMRRVSLLEPLGLWWRGELDGYVGRPLLAGRSRTGRGFPGLRQA